MGFLDKKNSSLGKTLKAEWKELKTIEELDQAIEASNEKPVVLYKHSLTCGISNMVYQQIDADWDIDVDKAQFYYLDLLNHRDVSNAIAEKLGVVHQSPQMILVNQGKAIYDASHHSIKVDSIKERI